MWHAILLSAYLSSVTADGVSGMSARAHGAHEVMLTQSPWTQNLLLGATAGGEMASTSYLWTHHHKTIAACVLIGATVAHGLAARHNWTIR